MAKKLTKNGKLIVCYPVLQGNGSKYTATNLAHEIKMHDKDFDVALVDLDFKVPYLAGYLSGHDTVHTIDNLIEKIDGGFLSEEDIRNNMVKLKDGVELLKGTKLTETYYYIKQQHIRQILIFLKRMYDVVIVAVSHGSDSLSATVSMLSADHILMIARNDFSNYQVLEREIRFLKNYAANEDKIKLIFNMYDPSSNLDFQPILAKTGVPLVAWVPFDPETINNRHIESSGIAGKLFRKKEQTPYDDLISMLLTEEDPSQK
jgi:Flp pilus assembly CpaE family ATPase